MWEHKNGVLEGFTKKYSCTRLVYYERYDDSRDSVERERRLKGWTRARKLALIESVNPRWQDLAQNWGSPMVLPGESIAEVEERLKRMISLELPKGRSK
jgi:putative endonuclease